MTLEELKKVANMEYSHMGNQTVALIERVEDVVNSMRKEESCSGFACLCYPRREIISWADRLEGKE